MYNFILQIAVMLSLGAMIYLIARALPRIEDEAVEAPKPVNKFDQLIGSLNFEKIDALLNKFLEKILRKVKLILLKLDNLISGYLEKIKSINNNGNNHQKKEEQKQSIFENKDNN